MKEIPLTQGRVALVSDEDYEFLRQFKWCASLESRGTKWYAIRRARKEELAAGSSRKIRMHRVVMERTLGRPLTQEEVVDHINHDSLNNTRPNLEAIGQTENMERSPGWKGSREWKADNVVELEDARLTRDAGKAIDNLETMMHEAAAEGNVEFLEEMDRVLSPIVDKIKEMDADEEVPF